MCNSKSSNKIVSLCLSIVFVLTMFVAFPTSASADDARLGLSSPDSAWWKENDDGNTDLTGEGVWTPVENAVCYYWELYWIDSLDSNISRDPDTDKLVTKGFAVDTIVDLADDIYDHDKYGIYYFMVCAMDEGDDITLNGVREYAVSNTLLYDESTDPKVNPDVNIGSRSSGGGSSGGGTNISDAQRAAAAAANSATASVTQTASNIRDLAAAARANGQAVAASKGTGEVTIQASAWSQLSGLRFQHDTVVNGAVEARVIINNPASITKDTKVSGYVTGQNAERIGSIFGKYFGNKTSVLYLDQTGSWSQEVRIAAKFDLTGMNTDNLVFYSYDRASNAYQRIQNPNYVIDSNGYTFFSTQYAGSIVVSDGPLVKK